MGNFTPADSGYYLDEYDGPRFWAHVQPKGGQPYADDPLATAKGDCWNWNGDSADSGYGRFRLFGRWFQAHRIAYRDFGKPLAEDKNLDHLCRNTKCVNPDHLEPVTQLENVRRGIRGAVTHCPSGHPYSPDNTKLVQRRGRAVRACRICLAASKHRTYLRRKAADQHFDPASTQHLQEPDRQILAVTVHPS